MRQKNKGMKKTGVLGFVILCLLSGCAQQSTESTEATTVAAVEAEALETVELKRAEVGDIVQMGDYAGESVYGGICCACGPIRGCTGTGEQTGYKG